MVQNFVTSWSNLIDDLMTKDLGSEAKPPYSMIIIALTSDFKKTRRAWHDYQDFTNKDP